MVHQNSSRRQLTYQMKTSLVEQIKKNPHQTTKDLQKFFYDTYNWEICQTTLSCILKKEGLGIKKSGTKPRSNSSFDLGSSVPDQQKLPSYPTAANLTSPQPMEQTYLHPYLPSNLSPPHENLHHTMTSDISNPVMTVNSPTLGLINMSSSASSSVLPPIHMSQDSLVQFQQIPLNQLNHPINQIPHYTYHTSSPIDSTFSSTDDSLKSGYKIYNTNILCNDDSNHILPVVHPNIHSMSALQSIHTIPNFPLNYSGLNSSTFTSFAQIPTSTSPSLSASSSSSSPPPIMSLPKQQQVLPLPPPPHSISTAPATPPSDNDSSISPPSNNYNYHPRSQLYDINIINPHVKRFRPSSQYQQLEKIVLKLACDLHRDHKSKMNDFKHGHQRQQHQFDPSYSYPNPTLSPPMTYTYPNDPGMDTNAAATSFVSSPQPLSNSEIVKCIKKEISTSPQYHQIPKPIYLNQFIHKCLRRYQFTDELIDRLSNVNPMAM